MNCLECSAVTLCHYPATRKLSYLLTSRDTFCRFQSNLTQSILGWRAFKIDIENGQTPFCRKKIFLNPFQKKYGFLVFNHFFVLYIHHTYSSWLLPLIYRLGLGLPPLPPKDRHMSGQLLVHLWHNHFQMYLTYCSPPLTIDIKAQ